MRNSILLSKHGQYILGVSELGEGQRKNAEDELHVVLVMILGRSDVEDIRLSMRSSSRRTDISCCGSAILPCLSLFPLGSFNLAKDKGRAYLVGTESTD